MKRPSGERPWWTGGNTKERWTSESRNTVWDFQRGACWMLEVIPLVLMSSKMGQIWGGGDLLERKWLNLRVFFFFFVNGSYAHGVSCSHADLCSVSVGMFQKCRLFHSLKTQMLSPNNTWRDATVFLSAWMKKILLDFRQKLAARLLSRTKLHECIISLLLSLYVQLKEQSRKTLEWSARIYWIIDLHNNSINSIVRPTKLPKIEAAT